MHFSTPTTCPKCGTSLDAQRVDPSTLVTHAITEQPERTYKEIGGQFGVSSRTVKRYAAKAGLKRRNRPITPSPM